MSDLSYVNPGPESAWGTYLAQVDRVLPYLGSLSEGGPAAGPDRHLRLGGQQVTVGQQHPRSPSSGPVEQREAADGAGSSIGARPVLSHSLGGDTARGCKGAGGSAGALTCRGCPSWHARASRAAAHIQPRCSVRRSPRRAAPARPAHLRTTTAPPHKSPPTRTRCTRARSRWLAQAAVGAALRRRGRPAPAGRRSAGGWLAA